VKDILAVGLIVEAVKDGLVVSNSVNGMELRRVQKPAAADTVQRDEIPKLLVTIT